MTLPDACELLVDMTQQCAAARAECDVAIAERDAERTWLRAALQSNTSLTRENWSLKEQLRRERDEHSALRERILEREAA